jgi:phosphohistidine phosphatase
MLVRHSKSSWKLDAIADSYRPLNARGYKDAHDLSVYVSSLDFTFDYIYSSPAIRAYSTALHLYNGLKLTRDKLIIDTDLYPGNVKSAVQLIRSHKSDVSGIIIVGHNDMISSLAKELFHDFDKLMQTSGVVILQFSTSTWTNLKKSKVRLVDYYIGGKGKEI